MTRPTNLESRMSEINGEGKGSDSSNVQAPWHATGLLKNRRKHDQELYLSAEDHQKAKFRNALDPTTGGAGGFTTPLATSTEIIAVRLGEASVMRKHCTVIPGKNINEAFPQLDDGQTEGRMMKAGEAPTEHDPSFMARQSFGSKFTSDRILAPFELVRDAAGLEVAVLTALSRRVGRRQNRAFTAGSGANEAMGLSVGCQVGKTTATNTAAQIDDVFDLQASLDSEYTQNDSAALMMNPLILAYFQKLKDGQGLNLWNVSGLADGPIILNSHMPSTITAGSPIVLYGDFARAYTIRELETRFITFAEMYVETDGMGYELMQIADGFISDDAAVKSLVVHS